ncbi:MAG: riboflavin synthase [Schwartzia sp. (in: firmicutes)]
MFTGIVEEIGEIKAIGNGRLKVRAAVVLDGLRVGDSIAVNGVCLTVTAFDACSFTADVMPETFRRTTFGALPLGSSVNLERALSLGGRLGGHLVSGHVDGVGQIVDVREEKNARILRISAPPDILRYVIEKGSVAIEGVSLTVAAVTAAWFSVSLIPHTREITTLHQKKSGDRLNIENDVVGKYVEKFLVTPEPSSKESGHGGLTRDFLRGCGF